MSKHDEESAGGGEVAMAGFLWVVVLLGLAYGISQTVIRAAALF